MKGCTTRGPRCIEPCGTIGHGFAGRPWSLAPRQSVERGATPHKAGTDQSGSALSKVARSARSTGRTTRATSWPSRSRTTVGHSFTWNERPSGLPLPSSIFQCGRSCASTTACSAGCAAWQWPHHGAPNSSSSQPACASTSARAGSAATWSRMNGMRATPPALSGCLPAARWSGPWRYHPAGAPGPPCAAAAGCAPAWSGRPPVPGAHSGCSVHPR